MRHLLSAIILLAAFAAPAQAQTVKTLSYGTNGRFITGTNALTFTNQINFAGGDVEITASGLIRWAGQDRIELETYTLLGDWTFNEPEYVRGQLGFSTNLNTLWTATNASNARSAVGIPLPALTNTSNVTLMRALAGSTNTNQPFSGAFNVIDDNSTAYALVVSNGIILSVTEY